MLNPQVRSPAGNAKILPTLQLGGFFFELLGRSLRSRSLSDAVTPERESGPGRRGRGLRTRLHRTEPEAHGVLAPDPRRAGPDMGLPPGERSAPRIAEISCLAESRSLPARKSYSSWTHSRACGVHCRGGTQTSPRRRHRRGEPGVRVVASHMQSGRQILAVGPQAFLPPGLASLFPPDVGLQGLKHESVRRALPDARKHRSDTVCRLRQQASTRDNLSRLHFLPPSGGV